MRPIQASPIVQHHLLLWLPSLIRWLWFSCGEMQLNQISTKVIKNRLGGGLLKVPMKFLNISLWGVLIVFYKTHQEQTFGWLKSVYSTKCLNISLLGSFHCLLRNASKTDFWVALKQAFFVRCSGYPRYQGFLKNWVFGNLELSFAKFSWFLEKFYVKTGFLTILELGFWLRTWFIKNLVIWVSWKSELGFWVLHKKSLKSVC